MRQRDFGGTSGSRGLTPGRNMAVATNARQTGRAGASWTRQRIEVESVHIGRVGDPTT